MTLDRLRHFRRTFQARVRGLARRGRPAGKEHSPRFRQALVAWADSMRWEGLGYAGRLVPPERLDPVPVEYPVLVAWAALSERVSAVLRYLAAPFGSYIALTIADTALRATVIRGNRVRRWAEVDLPAAVVRDGLIVGSDAFAERMAELIDLLLPGRRLTNRRVALTLTGRNMVQGRFTVFAPKTAGLKDAVLAAASERLGVRPGELEIDWHATPLPEDDSTPDEVAGGAERDAEEEPAPTHEIYAVGLYRNVVETNLRQIARLGAQIIDIQPRALALAAAVDEPTAIVVDIELHGASVVVVTDRTPEVVRDIVIDPSLPADRSATAILDELERSVGYHNSLYPDDPLPEETPLYVTGQAEAVSRTEAALEGLVFERWELPHGLRAPAGFPTARFAAGVGIACLSRGKPWWRGAARHAARPRLRFLPPAYRPRQMPVGLVLAGAAAAALILGLGALYTEVNDQMAAAGEQRHVAGVLDTRVQARAAELRNAARTQAGIEAVSMDAQAALWEANAIRGLGRGFAMTLTEVTRHRVDGIVLQEVDDDGTLVTVRATAAAYETLLRYVRALEDSGTFDAVAIRMIGNTGSGPAQAGAAPFLDGEGPGPSLTLELIRSAARTDGGPAQGGPASAWVHVPDPAR